MADLAELNLRINSSEVRTAGRDLDGMEKSASKAESAAGSLMAMFAKLAAAIGATALAMRAFGESNKWEDSRVSLRYLLGDMEKAQRMMEDLQKMSEDTPFGRDQFEASAKALLGMGTAAEDVHDILVTAADAAAALGTGEGGIQSISRALAVMKARGDLAGASIKTLAAANIPVFQMLADAIGISLDEAQKAVEQGLIDADTATEIILKGLKDKYAGAAKALDETNSGMWGDVMDAGDKALRVIADALKDTFNVPGITTGLVDSITAVGEVVADTIRILAGFDTKFEETSGAAELLATALKVVGTVLGVILALKFAAFLVTIVQGMGAAAQAAIVWAKSLAPVLVTLGVLMAAVAAFELGRYFFDEFRIVQESAATAIKFVSDLFSRLKFAWDYVITGLSNGWTGFIHMLKDLWLGAVDTIAAGLVWLEQAGEWVGLKADLGASKLYGYINKERARMKAENPELASQFAQLDANLAQSLANNQAVYDSTMLGIEKDFGSKERKGQSFFDFTTGENGGVTALVGMVDSLTGKLQGLFNVQQAVTKAVEDGNKANDDATGKYKDKAEEIRRLTNGIQRMIDEVRNETEDMAKNALQREQDIAARKAHDIALKENIKNEAELVGVLRQQIALRAQARFDREMNDTTEAARNERKYIGMSRDDAEVQRALDEKRKAASDAGVAVSERAMQQLEAELRANQKLAKAYETLRNIADSAGQQVSQFLEDIIFNSKNALEAVEALIKGLVRMVVQQAFLAPIAGALSSGIQGAFGFGGAGGGKASGGMLDGNTSYWVGENGPERFFPGRPGQLFSATESERMGGSSTTIINNMHVSTPDANSFRRSSLAIQNDLARATRRS